MIIAKQFSDKGLSSKLLLKHGESFTYTADLSNDFDGFLYLRKTINGGETYQDVAAISSDQLTPILVEHEGVNALYYFEVKYGIGETTLTGTADVTLSHKSEGSDLVGRIKTPANGEIIGEVSLTGPIFRILLKLTLARIAVTDAGGSGSYGSLKIFDFVETGLSFLGTRQNYTGYAEGAALTTGAGDAAFVIGVGTTAISAAADGVLAAGAQNVGASIAQTNAGGTTTGTAMTHPTAAIDGTTTPAGLFLNWSGSAATIDANSTIDVSGEIEIIGALLGDD